MEQTQKTPDLHTGGKWFTAGRGHEAGCEIRANGYAICLTFQFAGPDQKPHNAADNARRIVACVNACDGTSTEWLEGLANREFERARPSIEQLIVGAQMDALTQKMQHESAVSKGEAAVDLLREAVRIAERERGSRPPSDWLCRASELVRAHDGVMG